MNKQSKYACPKCGSSIKAIADIDAQISFEISKSGKLTKRLIKNSFQTDGRCGVECSKCDWKLHAHDMSVDSEFLDIADSALAQQAQIYELSPKREKDK